MTEPLTVLAPQDPNAHPERLLLDLRHDALYGLRVCFVNMPLREGARPNVPPQGPGLLAARLRQYGADVSIVDLNAYRIQDERASKRGLPYGRHLTFNEAESLLSRHFARNGEPDMVGISGKITTLRWQEQVARMVKKISPDSFLVSGGGLATELKLGLLNWIPELDAVAHSEGDDIVVLIGQDVLSIKQHGYQHAVRNGSLSPYYLGEIRGKHRFLYAGNRPSEATLNSLPFPAWDLLHEDVDGNRILDQYITVPVWGSRPFLGPQQSRRHPQAGAGHEAQRPHREAPEGHSGRSGHQRGRGDGKPLHPHGRGTVALRRPDGRSR